MILHVPKNLQVHVSASLAQNTFYECQILRFEHQHGTRSTNLIFHTIVSGYKTLNFRANSQGCRTIIPANTHNSALTTEDWNCPFDIVASCTVARPWGGTWLEVDDILLAVEARTANLRIDMVKAVSIAHTCTDECDPCVHTYSLFSLSVSFEASLAGVPNDSLLLMGSCSFCFLFLLMDPFLPLLSEFLPLSEALLLRDPNHPSSSRSNPPGLN